MQVLNHDSLNDYLEIMIQQSEDWESLLSQLVSMSQALRPGSTINASMSRWFGENTSIGISSPASLITWLGENSSEPMRWVIRDSVASCMAAYGIKFYRESEPSKANSQISILQRRVSSQFDDKLAFIKLIQDCNRLNCIDLIDAIELLDAVLRERVDLTLGLATLRGMLRVLRLYVVGTGDGWPNHGGSVKVFGFEVCARLIILLLKKMIMADDYVAPQEMNTFYSVVAQKYSIPPVQAQWIYEAAPLDFNLTDVCKDIRNILQPDKVIEVYEVLEKLALADEHFDIRESWLLESIQSELNISLAGREEV